MTVYYLTRFTPAEILFFTDSKNVKLQDVLKYTFADLVMRQELLLREEEKQRTHTEKQRTYTYVELPTESSYLPKPHEEFFLGLLRKHLPYGLLMRYFIRMVQSNITGKNGYYRLVGQSAEVKPHIRRTLWVFLGGRFSFTWEGKRIRKEVTDELKRITEELNEAIKNNPQKATEILHAIGANALLISAMDTSIADFFEREMKTEAKYVEADYDEGDFWDLMWDWDNDSDWSGDSDWD